MTLVMGDALAMALMEARGFSSEDFARHHPGGSLGRRLLLRLGDLDIQTALKQGLSMVGWSSLLIASTLIVLAMTPEWPEMDREIAPSK